MSAVLKHKIIMNKFIIFLQVLFATLFTFCSDEGNSFIPQVENGNFSIYVSNQSSDLDPVDLKITIDGKPAIKQEFFFINGSNHIKFQFQLDNRDHIFSVSSINGNVSKDTTFTLPATPYSLVTFWYIPAHNGYVEYKYLSVQFLTVAPIFAYMFSSGFNVTV